jgi:hypothetical protein
MLLNLIQFLFCLIGLYVTLSKNIAINNSKELNGFQLLFNLDKRETNSRKEHNINV